MDESYAQAQLPLVQQLFDGTTQPVSKEEAERLHLQSLPVFHDQAGSVVSMRDRSVKAESRKRKYVMVLPMHNAIQRNDVFCGPAGTNTLSAIVADAANDDQVIGLVLDMNTPGGEASAMFQMADALAKFDKPIVSVTRYGRTMSAGLGIISQADERYTQHSTDKIGSCGAYTMLVDMEAAMSSALKAKVISVYGSKSGLKNKAYRDAIAGNDKMLRENHIDPLVDQFHELVRTGIPNLVDDKEVFQGQEYFTQQAININLIDGTGMDLEGAVARVQELADERTMDDEDRTKAVAIPNKTDDDAEAAAQTASDVTNDNNMRFEKLKKTRSLVEQKPEDQSESSWNDAQAELDAHPGAIMLVPKGEILNADTTEELQNNADALTTENTQLKTKVSTLEARVKELENIEGDGQATTPSNAKDTAVDGDKTPAQLEQEKLDATVEAMPHVRKANEILNQD